SIPREHDSLKRSLKISLLEWEEAEKKADRDLKTKQLEIEEQERAISKSTRKLRELRSDLDELVVEAPHNGIVYYGANRKGKWVTAATVEKKLIPGGRATAREVLLTVVDPEQLQVRTAVAEDKLKDLTKDQKAKLQLKWNDDVKMESKVESISYIPQTGNTFDTVFSFDKTLTQEPVFPGMTAKLTIDTYRNENALTVPVKAVKKDGDRSYVIMKGGKKQWVETGRSDEEKQEILKGLQEGDEIEADISSKTEDKK
ncbi:MAG: HlyD family efflux transporter periplasmic adaptor subunit, partial [Verrucomicrobiales bacterium]|nr:HlyD family efflux transporter periplasmic adaptor subunit [Verrucomicrobiales bacterium]